MSEEVKTIVMCMGIMFVIIVIAFYAIPNLVEARAMADAQKHERQEEQWAHEIRLAEIEASRPACSHLEANR